METLENSTESCEEFNKARSIQEVSILNSFLILRVFRKESVLELFLEYFLKLIYEMKGGTELDYRDN